jgi:hypothetical protein
LFLAEYSAKRCLIWWWQNRPEAVLTAQIAQQLVK